MTMVLVNYSGYYNDEFRLEGFLLFHSIQDWNNYLDGIPDEERERSFGSNQYVTFEDRDDYLDHLDWKEISDEAAFILCSLLGIQYPNERVHSVAYGLFVTNSDNY